MVGRLGRPNASEFPRPGAACLPPHAEDTVVSAIVAVVDCNNIGKGDVALYKTAGGFGVARVWFHCRIDSTSLSCVARSLSAIASL